MDFKSVRRLLRRTRLELIGYFVALLIGTLAYALLELSGVQNAARGSAGLRSTLALFFIPTALVLFRLLRMATEAHEHFDKLDAVLNERDRLRVLIDSLPDFIYMKDVNGSFLLANKFCCDSMGAKLEQLLGKTDFDFYPAATAKRFFEDEQSVIRSGETLRQRQEELINNNGRAVTILTTKVPVKDSSGAVVGIIGIGRDISLRVDTERKLIAAQQAAEAEMRQRERMAIELRLAQKLESVGRLAAGLAHEINTPVQYIGDSVLFLRSAFDDLATLFGAYRNAALAYATRLDDQEQLRVLGEQETAADFAFLRDEVPKAFERTLEGTGRVAQIVRAMKEFAHPDAIEQKPADLNRALLTTLTVARSEYRYAARIETQLGELPDIVCNIGELNQVFLNLIVNSSHAIADCGKDIGSGVIGIRTRRVQGEVHVVISDNGCGIPTDHLDKIFDPFFTTKEVGRGTGQGLAIARAIVVDKHGGRIDVKSEIGSGTEFSIALPIAGRLCK